MKIGTQHRKKTLRFVPHPKRGSLFVGPDIAVWSFLPSMRSIFTTEEDKKDHVPKLSSAGIPEVDYVALDATDTKFYHSVVFQVLSERKYRWHVLNVFSVTSLLGASAALIPFIALGDVQDRFALLLTVLLTFIVYKVWISDHLPLVANLTIMDTYLLLAMFGLVGFWSLQTVGMILVCERLDDLDDATREASCVFVDRMCSLGFITFWANSHWILFKRLHQGAFHLPWLGVLEDQARGANRGESMVVGAGKATKEAMERFAKLTSKRTRKAAEQTAS